jgi:8-oxo-dGTP pyrophosphatase MutT (NUDIX family)
MNLFIRILYQATRFLLLIIKPSTVGVRLLMVRDNQILLVNHVYEDKWYLPGGIVEKGETLDQAARREALEEVGATLDDLRLFGTYTNFKDGRNDHIIVFVSEQFSLNGESDHEIEAMAYYLLDSLPESVSTGSENRVRDYLRGEGVRYGTW